MTIEDGAASAVSVVLHCAAIALVQRTTAKQGLPLVVADAGVLDAVAMIMTADCPTRPGAAADDLVREPMTRALVAPRASRRSA